MNEEYAYNETPSSSEVGIGLVLGFGYFTVFPVLPMLVLIQIYGVPVSGSLAEIWISGVAQIITAFIIVAFMMVASKRVLPAIIKNFSSKVVIEGLKYALFIYLAVVGYGILDELIFGATTVNENQSQVVQLVKNFPLVGILFTVLAAPIIEEVTYRYYLYKGIEKRSVILAFIVTVFLFAAMHLIPSISSGTLLQDLRSLPAYMIASFLFTFSYFRTKKILVPITAHMIYNGLAVLIMFLGT